MSKPFPFVVVAILVVKRQKDILYAERIFSHIVHDRHVRTVYCAYIIIYIILHFTFIIFYSSVCRRTIIFIFNVFIHRSITNLGRI